MKGQAFEKKILLNSLVLHTLFLFVWSGVLYWLFTSQIQDIERKKATLKNQVGMYFSLVNSGVTFDEYVNTLKGMKQGYELPEEVNETFFQSYFVKPASSTGTYQDFLSKQQKYIQGLKENKILEANNAKFLHILPRYIEQGGGTGGYQTTFDYINYLERLLYTFRLVQTQGISIGDIEQIGEPSSQLESKNIYAIPVTFQVKGRKSDILKFIHFFEHVGAVESFSETQTVFYTDDILTTQIVGEQGNNIYENKLANIVSLSFTEYPDTTTTFLPRKEKSSQEFLKYLLYGSEKDNVYDVEMTVHFFVQGVPMYEIRKQIQEVLANYDTLKKNVEEFIANIKKRNMRELSSRQVQGINTIEALHSSLLQLNPVIEMIRKNQGSQDVYSLYGDVLQIQAQLHGFSSVYTELLKQWNFNK